MHFLTLEFETDEAESDYWSDSLRRNKRFVEYSIIALAIVLFGLSVHRFVLFGLSFVNSGSVSYKPDTYTVMFVSDPMHMLWLILLLQYLTILFFRKVVHKHFQSWLFLCGLFSITGMVIWTAFFRPLVGGKYYNRQEDDSS